MDSYFALMLALTPTDAGIINSMVVSFHDSAEQCQLEEVRKEQAFHEHDVHLFCVDRETLLALRRGELKL